VDNRLQQIKKTLDRLYERYNRRELIKPDPLQYVYLYSTARDMEIAGFFAALLAYGRVQQIEKSLGGLFAVMGKSPYVFVKDFDSAARKKLAGFRHRFNTAADIADLLAALSIILKEYDGLEACFAAGYKETDENIIPALTNFCELLLKKCVAGKKRPLTPGLKFLLASPSGKSACKRMNLFLRWMVRNDDVDAGVWKSVDKSKLLVPVDVHIGRLCKVLGFYEQKNVSLSAAVEITESFKEIEPADPVKYDFALSRIGILENCTGRHRRGCEFCELFAYCLPHEKKDK
jgi:uncharacterized protein (TIGR02757 family)